MLLSARAARLDLHQQFNTLSVKAMTAPHPWLNKTGFSTCAETVLVLVDSVHRGAGLQECLRALEFAVSSFRGRSVLSER